MARLVIDENITLSPTFKVGDLTYSDTAKQRGIDNELPVDLLENAKKTASVLESLKSEIGPFQLESGYRSPELNSILGGSTTSRHVYAEGFDIRPTTMTADEYFGKILASKKWMDKLGEVAIKKTVIHATLPFYDSANRYIAGEVLEKLDTGEYIKLSIDEIQKWASPYLKSAEETLDAIKEKSAQTIENMQNSVSEFVDNPSKWMDDAFDVYDEFGLINPKPFIIGGVVLLGGLGIYLITRNKE